MENYMSGKKRDIVSFNIQAFIVFKTYGVSKNTHTFALGANLCLWCGDVEA